MDNLCHKAIVTGANGFLGRYLIDVLLKNEYKIWAVIRENANDIDFLRNNKNIILVYCNLYDYKDLKNLINDYNFDVFYHLAWDGSSGEKRSDYKLQLNNIQSSIEAVETAADLKCKRFVGVGSITEIMYREYLTHDGSSPESVSYYAIAKITTEYMCRCKCIENEIEFVWGYVSNFYGIGDKTENIINFLISSYINNQIPKLTEGEQLVDFTYVSDIALGLFMLGEKAKTGKNYYVGYGNPKPLKEFVVEICKNLEIKETGLGLKKVKGLTIDFENIDVNKLNNDTGFKALVSFEEGIKKTINWIKDK